MNQAYQNCSNCHAVQTNESNYCSNCAHDLSKNYPNLKTILKEKNNNTKTIVITAAATFAICVLVFLSYYLGTQSRDKTVAMIQPTIENVPVKPIVVPESKTNTEINSANANSNMINSNTNVTANINKPVKQTNSNANIKLVDKDKKREQIQGYSYGWTYLTETNDSPSGYYYYYKPDTIKSVNTGIEVWARKFPMFPKDFAKKNELTSPVDYAVEKLRFYCNDDTLIVIDQTYFDSSGSSIEEKRLGYRRSQPIVPGTVVETLGKKVCSENQQE